MLSVSLSASTPLATAVLQGPEVLAQVSKTTDWEEMTVDAATEFAEAFTFFALHIPGTDECWPNPDFNGALMRRRLMTGVFGIPKFVRRPDVGPKKVALEVKGFCNILQTKVPRDLYEDVVARAFSSAVILFRNQPQESGQGRMKGYDAMAAFLDRMVTSKTAAYGDIWLPLIWYAAADNPYGPCLQRLVEKYPDQLITPEERIVRLEERWREEKRREHQANTDFFAELLSILGNCFSQHPVIPAEFRKS